MKFAVVVIMFIVSFAIFIGYTRPVYQQVKDIDNKIQKVEEILQKAQSIRELREKLRRRFAEFTQEKLERLNKLLPDHVDNIKLLLDIDGVALKHGMRIQDIKLSKQEQTNEEEQQQVFEDEQDIAVIQTQTSPDVLAMSMQFSVESGYDNIKNFIRDLESSLRLIEIEKLTIEKTSANTYENFQDIIFDSYGESGTGTTTQQISEQKEEKYKATFVIKTYWLKKQEYEQ